MLVICRSGGAGIDGEESDLLIEVAADLGLALHGIENERRRLAFEQIVASSQDAMALIDRDYRILEANSRYVELTRKPATEVIGARMVDFSGPAYFERLAKPALDRCFAGETVSFEATADIPDTGVRVVAVQYSPHRGADRRILGAVVNARDITEQKWAQAALRESEARLSVSFHNSPVGIVMTRVSDGTIIDVNETFARFHGYAREEIIGRTSVELGMWARPDQRDEMVRRLRQDRSCREFEIEARTRTGELRDLLISAELVELEGDLVSIGVGQDITERKRVEAELRSRNVLLATQQEASRDGILVIDETGRHQSFNRRFVEMWGVPADDAHEGNDARILDHVSRQMPDPAAFRARVRALIEHRLQTAEEELLLADGRVFDRYSAPMLGSDGRYFGRLFHFRDVTERRYAEARNRRLEDQLRASQKMEAIGTLAGGVAHDFNNLLVVILNCTQFALDSTPEDSPARKELLEVQAAGERAARLTRQLLAFGRKQVLQPVPLHLNEVVAGLEPMLRRILGEDVECDFSLAPGLGVVMADPGQIEQVLMNLIVNARDAMPEGGALRVSTANVEVEAGSPAEPGELAPGAYVRIDVRDDGCGMDPETVARIFEPFYTTKRKGKGTGLGLSTSYGIVKQSGGQISVTSEPGRGSKFTILLPRVPDPGNAPARPTPPAPRSGGRETILVVEDEAALRTIARRFLEGSGYTVLTASDGDEAIALCGSRTERIDLLLTDVIMPKLGGGRLAQQLAKDRPGLRVLYMSGYTDDAIARHGVLEEGTNFLAKPFNSEQLLRGVREALDAPATRVT